MTTGEQEGMVFLSMPRGALLLRDRSFKRYCTTAPPIVIPGGGPPGVTAVCSGSEAAGAVGRRRGSWQHGGMGALRPYTVDRKPAPEAVAQRECTRRGPRHTAGPQSTRRGKALGVLKRSGDARERVGIATTEERGGLSEGPVGSRTGAEDTVLVYPSLH